MRAKRDENLRICRANQIGDVLRLQQEVDGAGAARHLRPQPQRRLQRQAPLVAQALAQRGLLPASALRSTFDAVTESNPEVLAAWLTVYRNTAAHWDLYYLAEKLVDVEDNFRRWRFNHVTTVERLIGHKTGSGGTTGVGYLRRALEVVLFPELWQVRTEL